MDKSDMTIVLLLIGTALATLAAVINLGMPGHSYLPSGIPYVS